MEHPRRWRQHSIYELLGPMDAHGYERLLVPYPDAVLGRRARTISLRHGPRLHRLRCAADDAERPQLGDILQPQLRAVRRLHRRSRDIVLRFDRVQLIRLLHPPRQPGQHQLQWHQRVRLHVAARQRRLVLGVGGRLLCFVSDLNALATAGNAWLPMRASPAAWA